MVFGFYLVFVLAGLFALVSAVPVLVQEHLLQDFVAASNGRPQRYGAAPRQDLYRLIKFLFLTKPQQIVDSSVKNGQLGTKKPLIGRCHESATSMLHFKKFDDE